MDEALNGIKNAKTGALIEVLQARCGAPVASILVVGCGSGLEAAMLARAFGATTIGIDIGHEFAFDHAAAHPAQLLTMDARSLAFADDSFDLVFSFHALEHIAGPARALQEMARVLKPQGAYLIGTPNRARLIGYIGSAHPLRKKLLWNAQDLWMRVTGRWRNESGAHAGFTRRELHALCEAAFGGAKDISEEYYRRAYPSRGRLVQRLVKSGLAAVIFPCVYVAGKKQSARAAHAPPWH